MWRGVPFACQRRPIIGVLRMCWLLPGSFDCFCCPHTSVHRPSIACLAVFLCGPGALFLDALSGPSTVHPHPNYHLPHSRVPKPVSAPSGDTRYNFAGRGIVQRQIRGEKWLREGGGGSTQADKPITCCWHDGARLPRARSCGRLRSRQCSFRRLPPTAMLGPNRGNYTWPKPAEGGTLSPTASAPHGAVQMAAKAPHTWHTANKFVDAQGRPMDRPGRQTDSVDPPARLGRHHIPHVLPNKCSPQYQPADLTRPRWRTSSARPTWPRITDRQPHTPAPPPPRRSAEASAAARARSPSVRLELKVPRQQVTDAQLSG